jgi:hypothetical protein
MVYRQAATTPPLMFLRPVGFAPGVALALAKAAEDLQEGLVRWRLPPSGMEPDAYIAPEGALGLPATEFRDTVSDTIPGESVLQLDEHGWYRGKPVCVVRGLAPQATAQEVQHAIDDDLAHGLRLLTTQLSRTRVIYELGAQVWAARLASRRRAPGKGAVAAPHPHVWLWENQVANPLAAADTRRGRAWLLPGLEPEQLDATQLVSSMVEPDAACVGFEQLPLAWLMWSYTQRCSRPELERLLPPDALTQPLARRRSEILGSKQMGRHSVAVIRLIEHGPRTASELQEKLGLTDITLRRVLVGLLLIRTIRVVRSEPRGLKKWLQGLWGSRAIPAPHPGTLDVLSTQDTGPIPLEPSKH